jgi:cyanophycinase
MPGILMPIGGNEKRSPDSEIFREMVDLAGGKKARIVVIPTASESPRERAQDYNKAFSVFEPASIETVHIGERSDSGTKALLKAIEEATLVMFGGGDQLRLSSLIGGTPLHQTLLELHKSGSCVIAGTSAGAAVLPETMIYQNNRFRSYRKGGIEMTKGFGMIQNVIFDTHFVQRSRISRLVHSVATNPALLGLGLEENTGLIIEEETRARVVGVGTVIVIDGSGSVANHIGYVDNGKPFTISNIAYSVLTPGVVFDLKNRCIIDPGPIGPAKSMVPKAKKSSKSK